MNKSSTNQLRSISTIISNKHFPIANLYEKGQSMNEMDSELKLKLDPSLREHFEVANINNGSALLLVSSSAWATRLRYNIPTILTVLNKLSDKKSTIKSVRIKIKHPVLHHKTKKNKSFKLSKSSANFLKNTADTFNDPELSDCFRKLSMHRS